MPTIHRLSNGVTVICETRKEPGNVAMRVMVGIGSAHEDAAEAGLTNLMLDSCRGGTTTRSRDQINEAIAAKGGGISNDIAADMSVIEVQGRGKDADALFGIMADTLRNPVFDPAEVAREQWRNCQQINSSRQDPADIAGDLFQEALYGQQSAARSALGDKALVQSFTPAQVKQRHAEFLAHPDRIVVSFAGNIDEAQALRLTDQYFGDLKPGSALAPTPAFFIGGDKRLVTPHEQVNLRLAFPSPTQSDPQRYNMLMFAQLLGGGMSSPLFMEIREKRGLVYGIHAYNAPGRDTGHFAIGAGSGGDLRELIRTTLDLIGDIAQKGFTQAELDTARKSMLKAMRGNLEHAGAVAGRNGAVFLQYGRLSSLEAFEDNLRQVTSQGIQQACAAMLGKGEYALSAVGPLASMPTEQEIKDMMAEQVKKIPVHAPHAPTEGLPSTKTAFNAAATGITSIADPQMTVLANGITVVTVERPGSLACGAWGVAGSDHETPAESGAAHMIEHMMFRGTPSYGPGEIPRIVEQELNANLNAYTSNDRVAYYFYNLDPDSLEKTIDICGEMVFKADIDEGEYAGRTVHNPDGSVTTEKGERSAVLEEIKQYDDDVSSRLRSQMLRLCYPGQSSGRPILGTPATLLKMSAADLRAYRDKYYAPNNMKFVAAGPVRHQDFVALIDRKFGRLKPGVAPVLPTPVYHGGTAVQEINTATMCEIMLAAEGVPATHPDAAAHQIMAAIFGGGNTSRLIREVSMRQNLSHSAGAGSMQMRNCGTFIVGASVEPKDAKKVINIAYAELRRMANDVTQAELDMVKARVESGMMMQMETSQGMCNGTASSTLTYGKPMTNADMLARIRAVTLADIRRVAHDVLGSNPTASFVVPPGTNPALLPDHAEVVAMRDGTNGKAPAPAMTPLPPQI